MTEPDDDTDEMTAAEYVLGTLDAAERAAAGRRIDTDHTFAARVEAWERRFAPLVEAVTEEEPPADLWPTILGRIGHSGSAGRARSGDDVVVLRHRLRRWRLATLCTSALAAALAAFFVAGQFTSPHGSNPTYVAFLQRSADPPAYVVRADLRDGTLAVRPIAATPPAGRAYQLWIIDPQLGKPRSLGVLDPAAVTHKLPETIDAAVAARATFAVTEEQPGGSPTGQPTSAPLFLGHLVQAAL